MNFSKTKSTIYFRAAELHVNCYRVDLYVCYSSFYFNKEENVWKFM